MSEKNIKNEYTDPSLSVEDLSHALFDANQKMAGIIKERDEIFANISHDLRSPITAIHNAVEYLESDLDISPEEQKKAIHLIHERTDALQTMINNIFLLTRLDNSGDKMLKKEDIPCGPFLEDFFYLCEADSKYSKRNLILDVPEDFNYLISIDPHQMNRVLDNLFNNALKHTSSDASITLSASIAGNKVIITVADDGEGISHEDLAHIFDRSYKVDTSRTPTSNSGAGLGLSICQKIISIHDGTISCESDPENHKGTRFIIQLPVTC